MKKSNCLVTVELQKNSKCHILTIFPVLGNLTHSGQFQQGENFGCCHFFLKVEPPCDQTWWDSPIFFNCQLPIIWEIVFRWLSSFWFLSSSSRTRAKAVWSWWLWRWWWWWIVAPLLPKLQTALARVLDELERNQKKENHLHTCVISCGALTKIQNIILNS